MSYSSHRRNHKRNAAGSGFAKAAKLLLSFALVFMVIIFFPGLRERLGSVFSPRHTEGQQVEASVSEAAYGAASEEITGEAILPTDGVSGATEVAPEGQNAREVQVIQVAVTGPGQAGNADGAAGNAASAGPSGQADLSEPLVLTFAGDILFDDRYAIMASNLERNGRTPDITKSFDEPLLSLMRDADLFMVNNEFPYSEGGSPLSGKKYTFRAKPEYASQLLSMGVDIVALANNHMYDYGQQALTDTLDTLKGLNTLNAPAPKSGIRLWQTFEKTPGQNDTVQTEAKSAEAAKSAETAKEEQLTKETNAAEGSEPGLPYVGAGRNIEEASAPVYFTNGKITVGIIAATQIERYASPDTKGATETQPGVFRCLDSALLVDKIQEMQEACDYVIAYLHWGTESTTQIDEFQKKLAVEVARAGADLIIGDHPHVLQGISLVEGVPVIYSLGNYLFNSGVQDTGLLTVTLDPQSAKPLSLRFVPARQENCRTTLLTGTEKARVIEAMRAMSDVSIDDEGEVLLP